MTIRAITLPEPGGPEKLQMEEVAVGQSGTGGLRVGQEAGAAKSSRLRFGVRCIAQSYALMLAAEHRNALRGHGSD